MPPLTCFQRGCIAVAVSQAISIPSQAAIITVDSLDDVTANGDCSLRAAIIAANTDATVPFSDCAQGSGDDLIQFDFTENQTITLSSGLPLVESNITINGSVGLGTVSISGNTAIAPILGTGAAAGPVGPNLNLINLTLEKAGVAIDSGFSASLSLDSVKLSKNTTGISTLYSDIMISNSTISGSAGSGISSYRDNITILNSTISESSISGISSTASSLNISGSTFSGNGDSTVNNGAVNCYNTCDVSINDSTFFGNKAFVGAAIYSSLQSTLSITNSTFSGNSAGSGGGVRVSGSSLLISNSTFSGNDGELSAGGVSLIDAAIATISHSIFSGNSAAFGGGIASGNSTATISNSTLSGNSVTANGGGIVSSTSTITIHNSTISENTTGIGLSTIASRGGGIFHNMGEININNSIIAGNRAEVESELSQTDTVISSQNNLWGSEALNNAEAFDGFMPDATDIIATSDGLDLPLRQIIQPLTNNGGPTQTHALPSGSPAIDGGNNVVCADADTVNNVDQRGEPRPFGDNCDIGSFEGAVDDDSLFVVPLSNGKSVIFGL